MMQSGCNTSSRKGWYENRHYYLRAVRFLFFPADECSIAIKRTGPCYMCLSFNAMESKYIREVYMLCYSILSALWHTEVIRRNRDRERLVPNPLNAARPSGVLVHITSRDKKQLLYTSADQIVATTNPSVEGGR